MSQASESKLHGRFWITRTGRNFAGQGRVDLLKLIKETGSISSAAKQMSMSYKAAWDSVDAMNKLSDKPLVERLTGGKQGGGTRVTQAGEEFLTLYTKYNDFFDKALKLMEDHPEAANMLNKLSFKTSADNSFYGTIEEIEKGAVSSIIHVKTDKGLVIIASVTNDATEDLDIVKGSAICALISANRLILADIPESAKISARNRFIGTVTLHKKGAVNSEVVIKLSNGEELKTMITNESASEMEIEYGKAVTAACKASDVILIV